MSDGIMTMLHTLSGNDETLAALKTARGQKIEALRIVDEGLFIDLPDGQSLHLNDAGQDCCEHRYMRTDDSLADYVGATLVDFELRDAPTTEDEHGDTHEVQFLAVKTSAGELVLSSHNEHNGYYGGFAMVATMGDT